MYYSYQIHRRHNIYSHLLKAGRLFQQYLVDAYVSIEYCRLQYIRSNQNTFRSEYLAGVHDAISRGDTEGSGIGKRVILPASFTGSPRYMYKHYQDALAICRVYGNPQYFVTFTCNVHWPEIQRELRCSQSAAADDRPDIIARVFQLKVKSLIKYLKTSKPFGEVTADLYTIEFQKRGLPHCHMLIWVSNASSVRCPEEIDRHITAELPDLDDDPVLFQIVTDCMLHGPCGLPGMNTPCMIDGKCTKGFPKPFEEATMFDNAGYVHYKRPANGREFVKNGIPLHNGFVVPYNKNLLLHFNAHINVECCGWNMLIKYLFKYISKGASRIKYTIATSQDSSNNNSRASEEMIDEVTNYIDSRFLCPHEATWRILGFPIHCRNPPVQVLAVHLEGMQNVTFKDSHHLTEIVSNPNIGKTTLTEWLNNNCHEMSSNTPVACTGLHLRYIDYLSEYRWEISTKKWIRRSINRTPSIGRLTYVHPTCGELFYLRLLLTYKVGYCSYADIRSVSDVVLPTYREACEKLGLIGDDKEWSTTFAEASKWATAAELRSLFANMLVFCDVSNPMALWEQHWSRMSDDINYRFSQASSSKPIELPDSDLCQYVLYEIEVLLNSGSSSYSLSDFGLPKPDASILASLGNRLLLEEHNYNREALAADYLTMHSSLRPEQRAIHDVVVDSIAQSSQCLVFVYGHGGTGKTYLWKALISYARSRGLIVLAVAASGIAALLLPSGRTAHSRFKIPLELNDESVCYIKKNTQLSQLLLETTLIIWDEAPMSDRRCFESLDKTLKDITGNTSQPFGGKSVLLGGDFRQTLPVKTKGSKLDIIQSCITNSYLWNHFKVYTLRENMRLFQSITSSATENDLESFSKWLLNVGDGKMGTPLKEGHQDVKVIEVPSDFLIQDPINGIEHLIQFIYNTSVLHNPTPNNIADRAIVCPKNETVDEINDLVHNMTPGESISYYSTDSMIPHSQSSSVTDETHPVEYLNTLNFYGIPHHCLKLKKNCPIMLLRNIDQKSGLCNGTRLLVSQLLPRVIEAHVITGTAAGHRVYIPRINFVHNSKVLPFVFTRRQFPVTKCYAMTINKSQGQSLNKIGIYLPEPVFGHGQLYVALSRATSPNALKMLIKNAEGGCSNTTLNIVFSDLLSRIEAYEVTISVYHMLQIMETKEIASIRPGDAALPIEVRVIRSWNPPFRDEETCFLLVDKHGAGIQASARKFKDQRYTEANLLTDSCYRIEGYACIEPDTYINTLSHPANLRIGTASTFTPIPETVELPRQYFEFASRNKIEELCGNNNEVTDYIGLLLKLEDKHTNTGKPYLSLLLKDSSNEIIEVALWEEISKAPERFNREAVEKATNPAVMAVTAIKVKDFYNKTQLWSTRATHVYLNPECAETEILISSFDSDETTLKDSGTEESTRHKPITIVTENKINIGDLLQKETDELTGRTFTFNGAITQITNTAWCQISCHKCRQTIYPSGNKWFCTTDGLQLSARYSYRISVIISDNTGSVSATIFDEAAKGLIGITCTDMVNKEAYTDMTTIPLPILTIKDKTIKFHGQATKDARSGSIRCTINKVTQPWIDTEIGESMIRSTPAPQTPQPPPTKAQVSSTTKRTQLFPEGNKTAASKKPR